ncbi:MAG: YdeI/OmpD-associated family protein [Myxococcales bacterium]|nr:YdeI/OmpD-associated family protein [Myxococcales bacterium]
MSTPPYAFEATIAFDPAVADGYMKHYLPLPPAVAAALVEGGVSRVVGTVGAVGFSRVVYDRPDGSRCLRFGEGWLRDAGLGVGDAVAVTLGPDPDPEHVEVPAELAAALDAQPGVALAWAALTPGKRRTLVYGVERARRPETRARRAAAVVEEVARLTGASRRPREAED